VKKVRLAIGVIGMPAAIGMVIPAAQVTTNGSHNARNAGKSVSLGHRNIPLITCGVSNLRLAGNGIFSGIDQFSGFCVHRQSAILYKRQTGLTERVRYYSGGGYLEFTRWLGGALGVNSTVWASSPNTTADLVCQALVANSNHNKVKYGPVCEETN